MTAFSKLLDQCRIADVSGHLRWELIQTITLSTVKHAEVATAVSHAQPSLDPIECVEADRLVDILVVGLIQLFIGDVLMVGH